MKANSSVPEERDRKTFFRNLASFKMKLQALSAPFREGPCFFANDKFYISGLVWPQ